MGVGAEHPAALASPYVHVEMHHLIFAVNPRISASRADDTDRSIRDRRESTLDHVLHIRRVRLGLPAGESTAVVFDAGGDAHTYPPVVIATITTSANAKGCNHCTGGTDCN